MITPLLAQAAIDIPISDTMKTLAGLIGIMVLGITVLTFVILVKKVFGAKPPVDKQIEKLRREIYEVNGRTKKALDKDLAVQDKRIDELMVDLEDFKLASERRHRENIDNLHGLELALAKLTGRIEAVLEKLGS